MSERSRGDASDIDGQKPKCSDFSSMIIFLITVPFYQPRGDLHKRSCNRVVIQLVALEVAGNSLHRAGMSKVEQMESELRKLSPTELRQIRKWLDDFIEDELEFAPMFENSIQRSQCNVAGGKPARVFEPQGS